MGIVFINTGIGLFIIAIGFLVKKYPNLIAGYNTLSAERKKQVDIEGLSTWMKNSFITMGILTIIGYFALAQLGYEKLAAMVSVFTIGIGTFVVAFLAQRYDRTDME
ncbi:MAG: DUF3784 domain-containing protein [Bacteroidota bacterium]